MHTRGTRIDVDGAFIHVQRHGPSTGDPMVFLHGGGGTLADFAPLLEHLPDLPCLLIDTRGHGASTLGDTQLSYRRLATDVAAVLDACELEAPIVVGHSDGGIAALRLALAHPERVSGIVTLAADAEPPEASVIEMLYAPLTVERWKERHGDGVALYQSLNPEPDFPRLFEALKRMWTDTGTGNYPGNAVAGIDVPSLVLGGDADLLVPTAATTALADALPDARLGVFPYASHMFHHEHPAAVAQAIRAFYDEV